MQILKEINATLLFNMATIWIDLTDLIHWNNDHLTGIQRTLTEILKVSLQDETIKYFYFQNFMPEFNELNKIQVQDVLNGKKEQFTGPPPSRLFQFASTIVPENFLLKIPKPILHISAKMIRVPLAIVKKIKKNLLPPVPTPEPIEIKIETIFNSGDTICMLGGSGGVENFMQAVAKEKAEKKLKVITLIYDLIPTLQPHLFVPAVSKMFSAFIQQALITTDQFLVISKNTKNDLEKAAKNFSLTAPPIQVIRLGDDLQETMALAQITLPVNYILCVCTLEIRKNHLLIYQAYKYLLEKYDAFDKMPEMLLVGGNGWLADSICYQIKNDPQINSKIRFINNCTDADLLALYKNCLFTVYPSVYEGWGLPIAESLKHGKFCLASNASSMPEIAGDLVDYFSPYDSSQFAELIWKYSNDKVKLAAKEANILSNFKLTPWKDSAEIILDECRQC